ncbi:hypothetical protein DSO57_1017687 [Entomophthora muscae]|uniref:Uncharacterized protein n=1 Tax=Entomophthora muscae TaxID=34485 RepID=A0ACC2T4J7_9FUNG|nr:hypothetical protein DSO57_1017687 [Entomophthora muscae]
MLPAVPKEKRQPCRGLMLNNFKSYQMLLDAGLCLYKVFPRLRSISFSKNNLDTTQYRLLVQDCLRLKNLKHMSILVNNDNLPFFFPLFDILSSLHIESFYFHIDVHLYTGPKKLLLRTRDSETRVYKYMQRIEESWDFELVPFGDILAPRTSTVDQLWEYFYQEECYFYLRMPLSPAFLKHIASVGITHHNGHLVFNIQDFYERAELKKLAKIPGFVDHLFLSGSNYGTDDCFEEYAINIPSLHFYYVDDFLASKSWIFHATKVAFGQRDFYPISFFKHAGAKLPNLQNLYISTTIPLETIPLLHGLLPQLIHLFSKVPQHASFWPKLMDAAPKLQYIHTNHIPHSVLEIENRRPCLQFMPYQDIYGTGSNILDQTGFKKYLFN